MKFLNTVILCLSALTATSAFSLAPRTAAGTPAASSTGLPYVARHVALMSSVDEEVASSTPTSEEDVPVVAEAAAVVEEDVKVEEVLGSSIKVEEEVKHTVYVGNLPFTTTQDDVTKMFEEKGMTVLNIAMPKNPSMLDEITGEAKSKGFCFVDVESEQMIVSAVEAFSEEMLDGRPMRVNKLLPKEEVNKNNPNRPRNFTPAGQKKLYIGNLPFEATQDDVSTVFAEHGELTDVFLPLRDGQQRGFCFVTMDTAGADKAMEELNGADFQGRSLVVNEPLKKGEKPPQRTNSRPQFKLYVGNLSFYTTQETLCNVFQEFGEVYDCYLPTDPNTDQPRGFGFITMERADGESAITELDGLELDGRFIRVNEAQGKRRSSPSSPPPSDEDEGGYY